ncbi:MAG: peptide deformylase [Christensenella sp.]|nr:peptide deformylase [Christensenella sp.]
MAIREIRKFEDEMLRKKCRPVAEITDRIRMILDDMAETMYAEQGGGLAGSQVGILRRLVVIDVGNGLKKLVNPEIVEQEGEHLCEEGCLSFPDQWGKVKRPERVLVKALDENGKEMTLEGTGLLAQCLCHEIDHLDGIVFGDKVVEWVEEADPEQEES